MSEKIASEIRSIFSEFGFLDAGSPGDARDVVLAELDLDSLAVMDLCIALEERYDFIVEPAEVMKQATLLDLARFIASKRPERAEASE